MRDFSFQTFVINWFSGASFISGNKFTHAPFFHVNSSHIFHEVICADFTSVDKRKDGSVHNKWLEYFSKVKIESERPFIGFVKISYARVNVRRYISDRAVERAPILSSIMDI